MKHTVSVKINHYLSLTDEQVTQKAQLLLGNDFQKEEQQQEKMLTQTNPEGSEAATEIFILECSHLFPLISLREVVMGGVSFRFANFASHFIHV